MNGPRIYDKLNSGEFGRGGSIFTVFLSWFHKIVYPCLGKLVTFRRISDELSNSPQRSWHSECYVELLSPTPEKKTFTNHSWIYDG